MVQYMTLFDRIKAIRDISGENHWTRRFSAEMTYMSTLSSTKNGEYDARIAEAADYVLSKKAENGAVPAACRRDCDAREYLYRHRPRA